ncbi:MAG TPA: aldehyde dehydrogenase family protein, partial [Thermoleophilaceae bacterium]|nr:aldehyde dehydrogenase family protein [Thermoleophilaceae bacterium]
MTAASPPALDVYASVLRPKVRAFLEVETLPLEIDGEAVPSADGATLSVEDPAQAREIARVPAAGAADVDRAVEAAWRARSGGWGGLGA